MSLLPVDVSLKQKNRAAAGPGAAGKVKGRNLTFSGHRSRLTDAAPPEEKLLTASAGKEWDGKYQPRTPQPRFSQPLCGKAFWFRLYRSGLHGQ
jgi:hypothetical protein